MQQYSIVIHDTELVLDAGKFAYLPHHKTIVIADVHLGKIAHFRRNGIALPASAAAVDQTNLETIFDSVDFEVCVFLGDLFHSQINSEWVTFQNLLAQYGDKKFILTRGNHDILAAKVYDNSPIEVVEEYLIEGILFTHEPVETKFYNIYGHIHPGVLLRGKGRQSLRISCFYFEESYGVLPAFGKFTGLYMLKSTKTSKVYAIADGLLFVL